MNPDDDNPQGELQSNAVTFNGETVTFNGEPVTFGGDEPSRGNPFSSAFSSGFGSGSERKRSGSFSSDFSSDFDIAHTHAPDDRLEVLANEMHQRLDSLETLIRQHLSVAPHRGHNHPPELVELERAASQEPFREALIVADEIRKESANPTPRLPTVVENASRLRRIAELVKMSPLLVAGAAASGIIGGIAHDTYKLHQQQIYDALIHASDAVMAWANHLLSL